MSVQARIEVERKIVRRAVLDAISAGYTLNVDYGDGDVLSKPTSERKEIMDAMMQGDDDRLFYHKDGKHVGWAWFVYGNDGYDVLSDYTVNLETVLAGANKLAERYAD